MMSVNNKLMLEPYQGSNKIKAEVSSGFAKISQKGTLVGLKLLADANISYGGNELSLKKGQTVYFEEEHLHSNKWSKMLYECKDMDFKFVMGDFGQVRFIK